MSLSYLFDQGLEISPHDKAFYGQFLKLFDDGKGWPKMKKLTLRGINLQGFEEEAGETFQAFTDRALPEFEVQELPGNYMFFSTRSGYMLNRHGADGLKPHLDTNASPYYNDELRSIDLLTR